MKIGDLVKIKDWHSTVYATDCVGRIGILVELHPEYSRLRASIYIYGKKQMFLTDHLVAVNESR